ncbi:MAG: hypothetical protein ACRDHL_00745 [Candidatus Promineifilaceae bacterium]
MTLPKGPHSQPAPISSAEEASSLNGRLRVSLEDVAAVNRLSLSCPICASAVERHPGRPELAPVFCRQCQTLYHDTCWAQNGGRCAVLGCAGREAANYGPDLGPRLKIGYADLPRQARRSPTASQTGRLKAKEKRHRAEAARPSFWNTLLQSILRSFGWRSGR